MNLTLDHLINVFFEELSSHRVKRFTMTDLIKASSFHKSTVYRYFRDMSQVHIMVYQTLIIDEVMMQSDSFEEMIIALVSYINENKIFCSNLYDLVDAANKRKYFVQSLYKQLIRFEIGNDIEKYYLVSGFILTLDEWFKSSLSKEKGIIIDELFMYKGLIS